MNFLCDFNPSESGLSVDLFLLNLYFCIVNCVLFNVVLFCS